MKKCKHCGQEIANGAKICPHCGGKNGANGCLIAIIGFLVICAIGAIGGKGGRGNSSSSNNTVTSGNSSSSDNTVPSGTVEESVPETPQETIAKPGDMVKDEHFEIQYLSCSEYKTSNTFSAPPEGKKYIKFDFTFKNISDTDTSIGSFECYCNNAKCDTSYVDSSDIPRLTWDSISGGRQISGSVVYEVPQDAAYADIELEYSGFFDNKKADKIIFVGA